MIIDAIMFNDEIDFLQIRLDFLREHVDHFVIIESEFTFSGKPKKLLAHQSAEVLRRKYRVSIDVISPIFSEESRDNWFIERETRRNLIEFLRQQYPHARVLFCDLDEVPSLSQLEIVKKCVERGDMTSFSIPTPTFYRYVNFATTGAMSKWSMAKTFIAGNPPHIDSLRSKLSVGNWFSRVSPFIFSDDREASLSETQRLFP